MAGPLSTLKSRLLRLTRRRADAETRALVASLTDVPPFTGFDRYPKRREFGDFNRARSALRGKLVLSGQTVPLTELTPWDIDLGSKTLARKLHSFDWLSDFEALASKSARARAMGWMMGWFDRFENGSGPGWQPDIVARRLLQLTMNSELITESLPEASEARVVDALTIHIAYLDATLDQLTDPIRRVLTLCDLIQVLACCQDFGDALLRHVATLDQICARDLSAGTVPSRNPDDLLAVFQRLVWSNAALAEAEHPAGAAHRAAIKAIAPNLRALRMGDATLARFHGGAGGAMAEVDRALAESRIRDRAHSEGVMGYVRLRSSRLVAVMDCARPPAGEYALTACASTLGFEMSSGRNRIVVNCGPNKTFGDDWARLARTTPSHSALTLDKTSSSQLAARAIGPDPHHIQLTSRPSMVTVSQAEDHTGMWLQARHDGYLEGYGLLHERRLFVGGTGYEAHGEDVLFAPEAKAERRFAQRIKGAEKLGVSLNLHFHIHPDVTVTFLRESDTIRLELPGGEMWNFRQKGGQLELEPSAYLDPTLEEPRPMRQIIVRARAKTHRADISWSFVRQRKPH
ncbi:heparinase II/III family protein [Halovulum sp. GXIMD14793]